MSAYTEEIFGPVLVVDRVEDLDEGIALISANPYGKGTAIFTTSSSSASKFQRSVDVGMIGINVPLPLPVAYHSCGGWKVSLFGDQHIYGPEGVHSSPVARSSPRAGPNRPMPQAPPTTSPQTEIRLASNEWVARGSLPE